ncbi:MAG: hypothetical protein GY903_21900 [Fuerstiella sp.]|nr:hypothetical protein [Fuerstiella sp.]MCP4857145.1 hypothetical protein [Fuerstiella sp.]
MSILGRRSCIFVSMVGLCVHGFAAPPKQDVSKLPENVALRAKVTASSEYSQRYLARFAIDGKLPSSGGSSDLDQAWCVNGGVSRSGAQFTLEWDEPVTVAEILYYARTAWFANECWKDYEVYLDEATEPAATGTLSIVHGPQRIAIPTSTVRKLTLRFVSSFGGHNPGASEIQVFAARCSRRQVNGLAQAAAVAAGGSYVATKDEADAAALQSLIMKMILAKGDDYPQGVTHRQRLASLVEARDAVEASSGDSSDATLEKIEDDLAALQRDVLLYDVDRLVVIKRHEINASHVYTYHYEGFRAGGGLYVISPHRPQDEPLELAASPDGQILDCDLSQDGRVVLFSWRQREDEGYHLWTINIDGTNLRQITDGDWHDYNACWLPDGDIAFLTTRSPQFAYCWHAPVGVLHRMKADGSDLRQLSANYLNDFTPQVLDDGRIIYTRWEYVDRPAIPIQSLWTINPDGTGLSGYFGNRVLSPGTFMEARQLPGSQKIICTMTGHNGPTRGAIGVIDRSQGMNAQAAIENITPDVSIPAVNAGNGNTSGSKPYSCPMPLDDTRFLVSAQGPVLVRTLEGGCRATALAAPGDGMQYFSAQPVRQRAQTPIIPSAISSDSEPFATIFLQDIYDGLEPQVKRGEITRIRLVRDMKKAVRIDPKLRAFGFQFPVISCGATYAAKDVIGEVPIETDGSAYFRVPAGTNISFMALDAEGRAVQRMRSFTHLMPGEVQGCVGCHEHRNQAPLRGRPVAYDQPPRDLEPPEWGAGGFDYTKVVQPVLDRHCSTCHNPVDSPGGVDLTGGKTDFFSVSYDVLARENQGRRGSPYVNWIPTYNGHEANILEIDPKTWGSPRSVLADLILSGHPDDDGKPRVKMDDAGIRRILAWIDLNVPYYGTSETAYPDSIGCRQLYPAKLDSVLADVARRRCAECHAKEKGIRREWIRITQPELNPFLLAPLSRLVGGSQKCSAAVFQTKDDADYQAILATFKQIEAQLQTTPRIDMPGGVPAPEVCRDSR